MGENVVGCFSFRDEGTGCLTATFLERTDTTPFVECAKRDGGATNIPFEGNYRTVWIELNTQISTRLAISLEGDVYNLKWDTIAGNINYVGRGYIQEGKLIGVYWNA